MRSVIIWGVLAVGMLSGRASAQAGNLRAERIAQASPLARSAYRELLAAARSIREPTLREAVLSLLSTPAPTFMGRLSTPAAREEVRRQLVSAGLLEDKVALEALFPPLADPSRAPQPFLSAPANGAHGHHSYPGGLAQHTAFNLTTAVDLAKSYERHFALPPGTLDRDRLIAAVVLHDAMKPWCLQWKADGAPLAQASIAQTASHHPFMVAEALHRRLPPAVVVALASAHDDPLGESEAKVVGYLRAGAILAGVDPVRYGLLVERGAGFALAHPPGIEAVINHLSDHDYALVEPAAHLTDEALDRLANAEAGHPLPEAQLNWMRDRIQAQLPGVALYAVWQRGGDQAVRSALAARGLKLLVSSDAVADSTPATTVPAR